MLPPHPLDPWTPIFIHRSFTRLPLSFPLPASLSLSQSHSLLHHSLSLPSITHTLSLCAILSLPEEKVMIVTFCKTSVQNISHHFTARVVDTVMARCIWSTVVTAYTCFQESYGIASWNVHSFKMTTRKTECSLELNMIFIHTGNCLIKKCPEKYIIRYEISFTLMMFVKFQTQLFTTVAMEGRKTYPVQWLANTRYILLLSSGTAVFSMKTHT